MEAKRAGSRRAPRDVLRCLLAAVACAVPACSSGSPPGGAGHASADRSGHRRAAPRLHVSGNRLVNAHGRPVPLHGVNRSGTEFMCVQGDGIFDGPADQASVAAMKSWGVNAIRVPLNEACWNGESYVDPGGGSLLRADAAATWYPARSAAEHIDPNDYRAAVISITMFNPKRHTVTGTFTDSPVIARLAELADGLHAAPDVPMGCPALLASYRITFVPASGRAPRVVVTPSGCLTVGVTAAGAPQPELWNDTGLIRAAERLLHVTSAR